MNIHPYLSRIGYTGSTAPTTEILFALQRAHLLSVPFENLDIHLRKEIHLDESSLFDKIVNQRRGGICYELNGLFAFLLKAIGFQVFHLNARGIEDDGSYGREFDHLVLQVYTVEDPTPWLVDAGWGNGPFHPLNMDDYGIQGDEGRLFQLQRQGDTIELLENTQHQDLPLRHYAFTKNPHELEEFAECCRYHQTSPDSIFTQKRVCSRFLPDGQITLAHSPEKGRWLVSTINGHRTERELKSEAEFLQVLQAEFGITLHQRPIKKRIDQEQLV
jgi:N-hydroxyarylamine O-acetyltransferase